MCWYTKLGGPVDQQPTSAQQPTSRCGTPPVRGTACRGLCLNGKTNGTRTLPPPPPPRSPRGSDKQIPRCKNQRLQKKTFWGRCWYANPWVPDPSWACPAWACGGARGALWTSCTMCVGAERRLAGRFEQSVPRLRRVRRARVNLEGDDHRKLMAWACPKRRKSMDRIGLGPVCDFAPSPCFSSWHWAPRGIPQNVSVLHGAGAGVIVQCGCNARSSPRTAPPQTSPGNMHRAASLMSSRPSHLASFCMAVNAARARSELHALLADARK